MRLLLDTHVLLWWLTDDRRLKAPERRAIADADALVYVSAASLWEIAIKKSLGRLEIDTEELARELETSGMIELPVKWSHARGTLDLAPQHADPFDRLLVSQARGESLVLVTYDPMFRRYDVAVRPAP